MVFLTFGIMQNTMKGCKGLIHSDALEGNEIKYSQSAHIIQCR